MSLYVNVQDWTVDQVTDWLKGLDDVVLPYTTSFLNNGVTGRHLLNVRVEDLDNLGVKILGHQELIAEAVEHLRHFHFELDKENLQTLALKVSCASNALYRELFSLPDNSKLVQNQTMSDVHNIITTIKSLVCWLDRSPFVNEKDYLDSKTQLLELSFEMATCAHRDRFSEQPVCAIRKFCEKITKIADSIIQDFSDPLILQPTSLDLATLRKKEQELGFFIMPHNQPVHEIAEIKYGSPAHSSSKIEEGDEIVQVNYQTVVGWQRKHVMMLLQDSPPEIVLTLKKRPRHTKLYGQIYMQPYKLPSKRRDGYSRWNDSIPSPRLLAIRNLPPITLPKMAPVDETPDVEAEELSSSEDSEPPDSPLDGSGRMYPIKPRPILQRRNTISGSTPTSKRSFPPMQQYWKIWKDQAASTHASAININKANFDPDSIFLRDKSVSCNLGLELSPRPTTVIGITQTRNKTTSFKSDFKDNIPLSKKRVNFQEKKSDEPDKKQLLAPEPSNLNEEKSVSVNSLASLTNENIAFIDEGRELTDRSSMATDTVEKKLNQDNGNVNVDRVGVNVLDIIKKFDEQKSPEIVLIKPKIFPRSQVKKPPDVPQKSDNKKPLVPPRTVANKVRGRLDKSHSTPAYDLTGDESTAVQKFVADKTPPDATEENDSVAVPKQEPLEPFSETTYELGIPIVEAINLPLTVPVSEKPNSPNLTQDKSLENKEPDHIVDDLPPKPPPRTFGVLDLSKPAYPIDSPKPNIHAEKLSSKNESLLSPPPPRVFEFPDSNLAVKQHNLYSSNEIVGGASGLKHPESTGMLKIYSGDKNASCSKSFEPKVSSTPKKDIVHSHESGSKVVPSFEVQKSVSDSKISPTNSIVRAMIYSNRNKTGKKKNSITAKRRKVTVNDLSPPDTQGYLHQRLRNKHNQNVHWEKRWFVLLGSCLYGFKTKDDQRASCLIFLSGFTVAVANEVKSRPNAFKVYHTGTVFYFSAEDSETLQSWIEMITAATLNSDGQKINDSLYSETDESDTEKPKNKPVETSEKNAESLRKFGSLKKFTSANKKHENGPGGSTSLDRKWFFNKSGSHSSKNSLPVPTAQFRSYRKIRNNDGPPGSVTTGNFTSHVAFFAPRSEIPTLQQSGQNISVPNLTADHLIGKSGEASGAGVGKNCNGKLSQVKALNYNYIHASNPSLANINDFNVPSFAKKSLSGNKCVNDSLAGFVTLEELMIKQSEERRSNPYNMEEDISINLNHIKPDVVYGEVPIRPKERLDLDEKKVDLPVPTKRGHSRNASDSHKYTETRKSDSDNFGSSCFGKRLGSLKKSHKDVHPEENFDKRISTLPKSGRGLDAKLNRSLPRTHKLPENCQKYASDRNLSFKERSYEMIYCPETTSDIQFAQNRNLDDRMYKDASGYKIKKQHSFTSADKKVTKNHSETGGYTNKVSDSSKVKLKSAVQYTPMSLPLNQDQKSRPKLAFELNLDEKSSRGGNKFKQIFSKPADGKKEKTFLGSPKLHRAIFRKNLGADNKDWTPNSSQTVSLSESTYSLEGLPPSEPLSMNVCPHVDYPGLEYPPIFEPETYSLADPQSSLTLLRKQGKN